MGRFEPSADPRDAVERGFYVPRPGPSIAEQLAARFEVKPSASHVLVGGIGSGKTTQLLVARDRLTAAGDVCAVYIDVSLWGDPSRIDSAALLAIVNIKLGEWLDPAHVSPDLNKLLESYGSYINSDDPWFDDSIDYLSQGLQQLRDMITPRLPHMVLLLDGLDRMSDLARFAAIVERAITSIRALGIGTILVGPLTALYGVQRVTLQRFDREWHIPAVDVLDDAAGREFLVRVLSARDTEHQISDRAAERLAVLSGGVLRDLVALTQAAGEEAYVDGADAIELHHVNIAADVFGRKQMVGLDSQQLAVLQWVRAKESFVQTSEKDLALLATRRVLEYAATSGKPRFLVHPTIAPMLDQIARSA